jgi:hypothetical protein
VAWVDINMERMRVRFVAERVAVAVAAAVDGRLGAGELQKGGGEGL